MRNTLLEARAILGVEPGTVRQWFRELEAHPERYQFETHAGFTFTSGSFAQIGARFCTRERFCGVPVTLEFRLTEVSEDGFAFELTRPALPVWGAFRIEQAADSTTVLSLIVGENTPWSAWFLRAPPIRTAVQHQISGEIANIKSSIEGTLSSPEP
jgi:hypothetical protein